MLIYNFIPYIVQTITAHYKRKNNKLEETIEDVLHDVVVYMYDKLHKYNPDKGKLVTYIYNGTRNVLTNLSCITHRNAHVDSVEDVGLLPTAVTYETPYTILKQREREDIYPMMWEAMCHLDPDHAQALVDKHIKGMNYAEIGEKFGWKSNSLPNYHCRNARKEVRMELMKRLSH